MKIDNYPDLRVSTPVPQKRMPASTASGQAASFPQKQRQAPAMRELGNALIVMQKAQMIVHEALSASSRLQNLAAEGMNSGSIDYSQINNELAQVSSAFEDLSPTMRTQVSRISENVQKAQDAIGAKDMTALQDALTTSYAELQTKNAEIVDSMGAAELTSQQASRMAAYPLPAQALSLQGNIVPERAAKLL